MKDFKLKWEFDLEECKLCPDLCARGEEVAEGGHKLQSMQSAQGHCQG